MSSIRVKCRVPFPLPLNPATSNIQRRTPNIEGIAPCTLRLLTPSPLLLGEEREMTLAQQQVGFRVSMREWFREILTPALSLGERGKLCRVQDGSLSLNFIQSQL